jgi:hypothetical protein
MKLSSRRSRVVLAGAASLGAVAAIIVSGTGLATASSATARPVVLVSCTGQGQVRPSAYVMACADGGATLSKVTWVSWRNVAFGTGTEVVNDCFPACVGGKFYRYPVLITLWRAVTWPHHSGRQYFSRMTLIHTGALSRPHEKLPLTNTFELSGAM